MLLTLALSLLPMPVLQADVSRDQDPVATDQAEPPTEPQAEPLPPEEAEEAILEVLKGDSVAEALEVIRVQGRVADKGVVRAVTKGFKHKDPQVRLRALEALRFNEDPAAAKEVLKLSTNKKLMDDPEFATQQALALGQHGDKKAIRYLKEGLTTDQENDPVVRSRVVALGKIREKDSVDILMDFWVKGAARQPRHPYQAELSMALAVLTGEQFRKPDEWRAWWNDSKNKFRMSTEEWPLPGRFQDRWDAIWAPPEESERGGGRRGVTGEEEEGGKRGERGEKGERGERGKRGEEGDDAEGRRGRRGEDDDSGDADDRRRRRERERDDDGA